jgi:predicted metal-dependent HD superfamily phosphohydrolase
MGVPDAPQWLCPSFTRSVVAAGATATPDQIRETADRLLARWRDPERRFHNLKHLVDVLARVDELGEETHEPAIVQLAAWYHGAVFDSAKYKAYATIGGEDEVASALIAVEELTALGVPAERAQRVGDLVSMLVRHSPAPGDMDAAVLCDADLAMLAAEPQKYKTYLQDVRAEYAHVPTPDYLRARARILSKLLARKTLFHSPLSVQWESTARQNLQAELHRVERELATLTAASADPAPTAATTPDSGSAGSGAATAGSPATPTTTTPANGQPSAAAHRP